MSLHKVNVPLSTLRYIFLLRLSNTQAGRYLIKLFEKKKKTDIYTQKHVSAHSLYWDSLIPKLYNLNYSA